MIQILPANKTVRVMMFLLDTNVISELRKKGKANKGVRSFFLEAEKNSSDLYISAITIGELRRGVELIRHRGDKKQAAALETWLTGIVDQYCRHVLEFTQVEAQVWGSLRVPHYENALDKQIAATALVYNLTVVTRNVDDFKETGVRLLNPFL